ncbi:MAG TPA: hypothetical protein VJU02_04970 [Nitrospiraceae bacterium]|nr:hypothetical protein [Nitrospiraceae bacterium]
MNVLQSTMLRHFPQLGVAHPHRTRDYVIAAYTFFAVAICLTLEVNASLERQYILGGIAFVSLLVMLLGEKREARIQVLVAVAFATWGEHFASIYMGGYTYRFENVPAYVPPGHGMVYLTAIAMARSGLFQRYARGITAFVIIVCGVWAAWGISGLPEQADALGALMFAIFLGFLFLGRSPMVYLAAFFITTWLELIGTAVGAWKWAAIDPVLGLSQANPPSGVTFWYCIVDSVAMGGAALVLSGLRHVKAWRQSEGFSSSSVGGWRGFLGLTEHAREDIQTQIQRTSQAISSSLKNPDLAVEPLDKT